MNTHEQYEELCALAATGQASEVELEDLRSHLETCPSCRSMAYDFTEISAQGLSMLAAKQLHCPVPSGMTQRFAARARSEGIAMSREANRNGARRDWRFSLRFANVCLVTVVLLVVAFLAIVKPELLGLRAERGDTSPPQPPTASPAHPQAAQTPDTHLQEQLTAARLELSSMSAAIRAQRAELESVKKDNSSLNSRLTEASQQNGVFQADRAEREARIKQLEAELENSKSEKNANDVALALQEAELRELRKQVSDEAEALEQQRGLAATGSDVRDLVVARNLHIIDVYDRDGNGKSQRAFGRIFYTEGKSLIFYAYDLADPRKLDAKVSFYVWGERLGTEKPVRSLGIFHNDDASDGRWVLTFDDPRVLAQIDSVFVTVESSKKLAIEPRGQRILFAFLGGKPNHP